ncbi:anti-sigma factor domain-containing protein [Pseudonocardia zijingensis]|uniref:Regulator of SigK n=1 Tax=Pseudonocardia zijingensis TaxID=153376 RepID=A0ABN1N9H2_9PSEU
MDHRSGTDGAQPCPWDEEAVALALHALAPDEEAAVRDHVLGCRACSEAVRETEVVAAAVGGAVEQVDPPVRLRTSLMAAAAETPQVGAVQPHPRFARPRPARTRSLVAAAAAAALIAIGGLGGYAAQVHRERDALAAQAQALAVIVTQLDTPGSAHAVLSTGSGQPVAAVLVTADAGTVVTTGLGANDTSATTYVLWGLGTGDPRPLTAFDVAGTGPGIHEIGATGAPYTSYAVSLEPGREMPAVPTEVVASGPVQT